MMQRRGSENGLSHVRLPFAAARTLRCSADSIPRLRCLLVCPHRRDKRADASRRWRSGYRAEGARRHRQGASASRGECASRVDNRRRSSSTRIRLASRPQLYGVHFSPEPGHGHGVRHRHAEHAVTSSAEPSPDAAIFILTHRAETRLVLVAPRAARVVAP